MNTLKELANLLTEGKKKKVKVTRKVARAVYHRDYQKTKNKPYRQYDPARTNEGLEEGMFDYMKGARAHVGQKVGGAIKQAHQTGQIQSKAAEYGKLFDQTMALVNQFKQMKQAAGLGGQQPAQRQAPAQQPPAQQAPAQQPAQRMRRGPGARFGTPTRQQSAPGYSIGAVRGMQQAESFSFDLPVINEGFMDYMKGAGSNVVGRVKQAVGGIHQAGQQRSQMADLKKMQAQGMQMKQKLEALAKELIQLAGRADEPEMVKAIQGSSKLPMQAIMFLQGVQP